MKRIVLAGLLVFVVVLLVTFPARVAYNWFVPAEIQLSGISGSIWHGAATEGMAGGAYVSDLTWQFRPSALLRGKLAVHASASLAAGRMDADLAVGLDGSLSLTNLHGNMQLDMIHAAFQQTGLQGDVVLQFTTLTIKDGLPVAADGTVTIADFYSPSLSASPIGDYRAEFQTNSDGISGVVEDVSGVLEVEGNVQLLQNRSYVFTGQVAATAAAPPSITNQLKFLGSPNESGQRPFRFEGQL
jgi:general secretion pathway protein N